MGFSTFSAALLARLLLLSAAITALVYLFLDPRFVVATALCFVIVALQVHELWYFLNRMNRELQRFLAAARHTDFSQDFDFAALGGSFAHLGTAFNDIMGKLKRQRAQQESELHRLQAIVENSPVAMLAIHEDDSLSLLNNAARRLFGSARLTRMADLAGFGPELLSQVQECQPGDRRLATVLLGEFESRFSISSTEIRSALGNDRLVSLHDIGRELESTQLSSWQELVRILTHEIMNSITPISSLAQTTAELAQEAGHKLTSQTLQQADLARIDDAASTASRRASTLLDFVSNYRQLTRLPAPDRRVLRVAGLCRHVAQLLEPQLSVHGTRLNITVTPPELELYADPEQLEQCLINLVTNAGQALEGTNGGVVDILAGISTQGRGFIEVRDNGPGIDERLLKQIFLPYFTTKPNGSGIGLALARQIVIAHEGNIRASNRPEGGARFRITI